VHTEKRKNTKTENFHSAPHQEYGIGCGQVVPVNILRLWATHSAGGIFPLGFSEASGLRTG
jgi:hypothetical protein